MSIGVSALDSNAISKSKLPKTSSSLPNFLLIFGIFFRLVCDQLAPSSTDPKSAIQFFNVGDRDLKVCWFGAFITDNVPLDAHCWPAMPGKALELTVVLHHGFLIQWPDNQTAMAFVTQLPSQKFIIEKPVDLHWCWITPGFLWECVLRIGLHPYYPVRWINHHRDLFEPVLTIILFLFAAGMYVSSQGKMETVADASKTKNSKAQSQSIPSHWLLLAVACPLMILDHAGRMLDNHVLERPQTLWYRVFSVSWCLPTYAFLVGVGTSPPGRPDKPLRLLQTLTTYVFLNYIVKHTHLISSNVLLTHVLTHVLLSNLNTHLWTPRRHACIILALLLLHPFVADGLFLTSGNPHFLFAFAGKMITDPRVNGVRSGKIVTSWYAIAGAFARYSGHLKNEYRPVAAEKGWVTIWPQVAAFALAAVIHTIVLIKFTRSRVQPFAFFPRLQICATRCCSFVSGHSLMWYALHIVLFDIISRVNDTKGEVIVPRI